MDSCSTRRVLQEPTLARNNFLFSIACPELRKPKKSFLEGKENLGEGGRGSDRGFR